MEPCHAKNQADGTCDARHPSLPARSTPMLVVLQPSTGAVFFRLFKRVVEIGDRLGGSGWLRGQQGIDSRHRRCMTGLGQGCAPALDEDGNPITPSPHFRPP